MYNCIKQLLIRIIPKGILFKSEPFFRRLYYQFYKGKKFQCNICNRGLRRFILLSDNDTICPNCGSISRNRRLWNLLESEFLRKHIKILDFSPSRSLYRRLKSYPLISYTSTDISGDFISDKSFDITNIDSKAEAYDLIICYHILEHVENDNQAIKELYRILKNNGVCIIQTPFKEGEIYENPLLNTDDERLKHFGQKDHVRIYSSEGLKERVSTCGFHVDIREYMEEENNKDGFKKKETILICVKKVA